MRPLWYTSKTLTPGLVSIVKRSFFRGPTTRKKLLGCRTGSAHQQNQKKQHSSSGSPLLQQSTVRQSLFPASQFELSEAIRLSFRCDNHDVTPCLDDLPQPLNCGLLTESRIMLEVAHG